MADDPRVAEFALTVIDEYQGLGFGGELLKRLIATARENRLRVLKGDVLVGNRAMLALCRRFDVALHRESSSSLTVDIRVLDR